MRGLLVALAGVAALALVVTHRHYAARDAEAAVVALMTHRFDGTTRSRLNDWLRRHALAHEARPEQPGPFARRVRINLRVDATDHWFSVGIGARDPAPLDAAAQALVERVKRPDAGGAPGQPPP